MLPNVDVALLAHWSRAPSFPFNIQHYKTKSLLRLPNNGVAFFLIDECFGYRDILNPTVESGNKYLEHDSPFNDGNVWSVRNVRQRCGGTMNLHVQYLLGDAAQACECDLIIVADRDA